MQRFVIPYFKEINEFQNIYYNAYSILFIQLQLQI